MKETDEKWLERIRLGKASGQTAEAFAVGQPFKASTPEMARGRAPARGRGRLALG